MNSLTKNDSIAGFCVFLLALPWCLGIATFRNFLSSVGVLSAIRGGDYTYYYSKEPQLAIKGPTADPILRLPAFSQEKPSC